MSFGVLCETSKELAKVLDSGDDSEQLLAITESGKNAIELIKERQLKVKRLQQALLKLGEEEGELSSIRLQENEGNNKVISNLEKEKYTQMEGIEKQNAALESLENSMREIDLASSKLRDEKAGVQHQASDALPKTKYSFSLYSNVTRLRWDYDTDGDKLQGFVTSLRDVRPFSLNLKEHSSHFIANYLWDVIASAKNSKV